MSSTSAAVRQLSDANSQGTVLGQSTTDKIGFYGLAAPIVQPTLSGSVSSNACVSTVVAALVNLGLAKDSTAA